MRIAFLTTTFPGVSQTFIVDQVTGLLDQGHDVRVFPLRREGEQEALRDLAGYGLPSRTHVFDAGKGRARRLLRAGGALLRHGASHPLAMATALSVRKVGAEALTGKAVLENAFFLEQGFKSDVIYCHFGPNGVRGLSLRDRGLLNGPLVTVFHAYDLTRHVRLHGRDVYRELFARGDLFLPITDYAARKLAALGCPRERMRVHPMGVDCERFAPSELPVAATGTLHLLSVGRLVEKKGFEYAIEAVDMLVRQGVDVRYSIVGDGPLGQSLRNKVDGLGLQGRVEFVGPRGPTEVREAMARCDVFVAPSVTAHDGDEEGLPVVLMEALAMGKPVVSTVHAAVPELVQDGVCGLLVRERDAYGLAECLARLDRDRELMAALATQGRSRVLADYNKHTLNARLGEMLTGLV